MKVYITKGLPASGKSTWAKALLAKHPNQYKRVNKDDLRAMLDDGFFDGKNTEKFVLQVRDQIIMAALANGKHVIVDDTNLDPKHEAHIRELVSDNAEVVIEDFTHVSLDECIARDQKRQNYVGEKVIRNMHTKYLSRNDAPIKKIPHDHNLPDCVVFDVDGTLAIRKNRGPFEWDKVGNDDLNLPVSTLLNIFLDDGLETEIFIVSGRDEVCRTETEIWLAKFGIIHNGLFMRKQGDMRKDAIIKEEIYRQQIEGKYNVLAIFDDRNQTVAKWRELGLPCFQVADGDF